MNERSMDPSPLVTAVQRQMHDKFRSVPEEGLMVEYLGKQFKVRRGVFWPTDDSKPLVENYVINKGDRVLDVCTGSGVIAIFSAYKGASQVLGLDINLDSVRCARENAKLHGFEKIVEFRFSDMFQAVRPEEKFDVITMNPPFRDKLASDYVEGTMWDTGFLVHKEFFNKLGNYLTPEGRAYISQASFGDIDQMEALAYSHDFNIRQIGRKHVDTYNLPRVFYAFELTRRQK